MTAPTWNCSTSLAREAIEEYLPDDYYALRGSDATTRRRIRDLATEL